MRVAMWTVLAAAAATSAGLAGCLKKTAFNCGADDNACVGGVCEPEGFCSISVATSECPSGRKFSDTAGDGLAGQCVGDGPTSDGPGPDPDGPETDGPQPDSPATGCNADFAVLASGGNTGHKYKLITLADDWVTQHNTVCVGQASYLAVPDDAAELAGLFALAANANLWVGVNDRANEGNFREVLTNGAYVALPVIEGGGNENGQDCAATANGTTLETEDCDQARVAVCECNE
jgi:hypothetical protein